MKKKIEENLLKIIKKKSKICFYFFCTVFLDGLVSRYGGTFADALVF